MTCAYSKCKLDRPLNHYEIGLKAHVPCLNAKHREESFTRAKYTDPRKAAQEKGYYQKRKSRKAAK